MYWPALKPSPAKNPSPPAMASALPDPEEIDDGWVVLPPVAATATAPKSKGKPPRPPPSIRSPSSAPTSDDDGAFDPTPDDIVRRYLPLRRSLRCDGLPRQIHDADVYGAHPGFLAAVYPAANGRPEWFFFVCRAQCQGGRRRAGPGAYRLGSEARLLGGTAYCHAFRYYEDEADVGSASTKETQWRMDEYGDCRSSAITAAAAFDMVICKLYPTRGGTIQQRLGAGSASLPPDADANKPQLLVRLYLDAVNLGDPRRCRMYAVSDVFAAHPAVLTATFPAANDRCEWFFAVQQPTRDANEDARPRKAGPGAYVPMREGRAVNGKGGDVGYRRVFLYREDDETARRVSRTEWWMEEYGFGRDFPSGELPVLAEPRVGEDEELVVYKLYIKMVGDQQ
ncbi:uncharacterized protein LOC124676598 [Lolium rigidum]|uniref:uncharacterized protein LOC124676598 n=1 Tax=Lolium rigidum TaxID=89674 RepID=UPI001F5C7662|nr:uncharacterized protein LOC124676598 [Lolium rigidum]